MIANIITTHTCNLRCMHCYMNDDLMISDSKNILPLWKEILRKAPELDIHKFNFTGGEVTTCSQIHELLRSSAEYEVSVFTNGITMPADVLNNCNEFWISLDGAEPIHNKIRSNECAFYRTWNNCVRIKEHEKKLHIQTTINKINIEYLEMLLPLYKKLLPALDSISLVCVINKGNAHVNNLALDAMDLKRVKKFKENLVEDLFYKVFVKDNLYTYEQIDQFILNESTLFPLWIDLITERAFVLTNEFGIDVNEMNMEWYYDQVRLLKAKLSLYFHEYSAPFAYYNIENILA